MKGFINRIRQLALIAGFLALSALPVLPAYAANIVAPLGSAHELHVTTTKVTAAQLAALNTTPIILVPAPGTNVVNVVHEVIVEYNYSTAAYTGGAATLEYAGSSNDTVINSTAAASLLAMLQGSASGIDYFPGYTAATNNLATDAAQAIELTGSSNMSGGSGTATVIVWYDQINTP